MNDQAISMGTIVLDLESKDIMKVSNGIEKDGKFTPTECICLRVLSYKKTKRGLYPVVGFSYRKFPTGQVSVLKDCNLFVDHGLLQGKFYGGRF